jgi:hypothetical protein
LRKDATLPFRTTLIYILEVADDVFMKPTAADRRSSLGGLEQWDIMHERAGTRSSNTSSLQLFALLTIAGAVFLKTAPHIGPLTSTPKSDKPAAIAEATPDKSTARLMARGELQKTKPKSATAHAWIQPRDAAPPLEEATAAKPRAKIVMTAEALPLPAPKQGSAMLTFTVPSLPVTTPKQARSAKSEASSVPKRAPQQVATKSAGIALQQTGRASGIASTHPR